MPNWKGHYKPAVKSSTKAGIKPQKKATFMIGDWNRGINTVRRLMAVTENEAFQKDSDNPEGHGSDYDNFKKFGEKYSDTEFPEDYPLQTI